FGVLHSCTVAFFKVPYSADFSPALDEARALRRPESDELRRVYAGKLAELTDKLFQLRALHSDYHLGNILISGADRLSVIDLNAVRFVSQVYPEQKLKVLSRIALSHAPFARKVRTFAQQEVEWLCESFAAIDPSLGNAAELQQKVLTVAGELEAIRLKSRDKRCLVSSSLYENKRRGSKIVYRRRAVDESDIEVALKAPALETLHKSARGFVDVIEAPPSIAAAIAAIRGGEAPKTLVRKSISNHRLKTLLDSGIRDSKGMRSWKAARALEVRELETALMLALVETKKAGLFTSGSVIFMEHIQDSWMVHRYLEQVLGAWPSEGAPLTTRFQFIRELAEFLARIQENGIRHHDLAVQNVLVRPKEAGGHELFLIDLDTVRLSALRRRDRIRNLVHFSDLPDQASSRDKLRFFKHYLENGGQTILEPELQKWGRRGFIQEISRRLDARMEAKRQRALKRANH
ncbi:MAG: lipopolysaccharide kinase InaA family protein, partial [Planctomycetota bacterium]|nr:lipopolysaccharide kinase InaA family protein [Planctomycetota bacterium]